MLSESEAEYFSALCQEHKLSEKPAGAQELFVSLFLLAVQIRREAELLASGKGDVNAFNRLVQMQTGLSDRLGLCPNSKSKISTKEDPLGVMDYLTGNDSIGITG